MSAAERTRVQRRFETEDQMVVGATVAFGMGIDRADVRFVIHLDIPWKLEGYYEKIGRAGRDGEHSEAWLFYHAAAAGKLRMKIEANAELANERKAVLRVKTENMLAFIDPPVCRRGVILRYFGNEAVDACGSCDICMNRQVVRES